MACLQDGDLEEFAPTPSHPFTPDVVAWAEDVCRDWMRKNGYDEEPRVVKAARQILVATGRG